MTRESPSITAWLTWARASALPIAAEAEEVAATFAGELDRYIELISGPAGEIVGLMTRGEDETFTRRAEALMRTWSMPDEAIARFREQAAFFEHKRAFLKLEWGTRPEESVQRLIAYYHRRRPAVPVVVDRYARAGIAREALDRVVEFAARLEKSSIHFVAAAMRPGRRLHHKLYFSQWVTADTVGGVSRRLGRVLDLVGFDPVTVAAWLEQHARLLPLSGEHTIFVSMKLTDDGLLPGMKIDYPSVTPDRLAMVAGASLPAAGTAAAHALCRVAGTTTLSFVGVTLVPGEAPRFKLYADPPIVGPADAAVAETRLPS